MEGPGHLWNPGLFVDVLWNGGPVGKLIYVTNTQKPLQNFVQGIWDALILYKQMFADPLSTHTHAHTLHLAFKFHNYPGQEM